MSQVVTAQQLIPASVPEVGEPDDGATGGELKALYEYEPDEESLLAALRPRNVATQVYTSLLGRAASAPGGQLTGAERTSVGEGKAVAVRLDLAVSCPNK